MATRMNISVPEQVKRRMDRVKEPVNWSKLAVQAFEQRLGEIASKKEKKVMADVIDRLRASKAKAESELAGEGRKDGHEWARDHAEAADLKRIAAIPLDDFFIGESAYDPGECFYFVIEPNENGNRAGAADFWESVLGDETFVTSEAEYVTGFANGALDLWREVEGKL